MNRSEETVRVLARLYKTASRDGAYCLRGRLPDGREIEMFANQRKRQVEDPDFLLVVVTARGEAGEKSQGSEQRRSGHET